MPYVEYSVENRIGFITLNRPDKRNALSFELIDELTKTFRIAESDAAVKVVILRARGDVFCAGADLAYLQKLQSFSYEENLIDSNHLRKLLQCIYTLNKVVIAQVHGHAIAGGCGLASVCDFVYSVPASKFGYTEVKLGFIPALVMVFLLRRISESKARELLLSGELITASEAADIGLVNKVVEASRLEEEVLRFAQLLINTNSAESMARTKRMISEIQAMQLDPALEYAAKMNADMRTTDDFRKGVSSFLEKKKLTW